MEIQSLRLFEPDLSQQQQPTPTITPKNFMMYRKIDLSNSSSIIPGQLPIDLSNSSNPVSDQLTSDFLAAVYGYVGPSIVTFGLIGNLLILLVVGRSSMSGKLTCLRVYCVQQQEEERTKKRVMINWFKNRRHACLFIGSCTV
jgi:hypothetical protein